MVPCVWVHMVPCVWLHMVPCVWVHMVQGWGGSRLLRLGHRTLLNVRCFYNPG